MPIVIFQKVPFELNGTPRRTNLWWQWECSKFENMIDPWPIESTEIKKKDSIMIDDPVLLRKTVSRNAIPANNFFNQLFDFDE